MNTPEITEEKRDRLLKCLVRKFIEQYGHNTHKLPEKVFYLMDHMGCSREAGLNYEYGSCTQDGDLVNVMSSVYAIAVDELAHRGLVELKDSNLTFVLTSRRYDAGISEPTKISNWHRMKRLADEYQGLIALVALFFTGAGVIIAFRNMLNA